MKVLKKVRVGIFFLKCQRERISVYKAMYSSNSNSALRGHAKNHRLKAA